jgi:hypothetical protein
MSVARDLVRRFVPAGARQSVWSALSRATKRFQPPPDYEADGLAVWGKTVAWRDKPDFAQAYRAGIGSGHTFPGASIEWRVHIACWAAANGLHLDGDFVECGVNTGIISLAICNYLDWNSRGRRFWLLDTYVGIPEAQMLPSEREHRTLFNSIFYQDDVFEKAKRNFAPYPSATLVRGLIPDTLPQVTSQRIAYLHIDMNIAAPEVAAAEFFWPRLVPGAVLLLDDYAWTAHKEQRDAMDRFAAERGVQIAALPTGQGIAVKPPQNR